MDIVFKNERLEKLLNSEKELVRVYGKKCANKIGDSLVHLKVASNLESMRMLPGRCHELKGDRRFQLSLDVSGPLRLVFTPLDESLKVKTGLDWRLVNSIMILGVEDTHE